MYICLLVGIIKVHFLVLFLCFTDDELFKSADWALADLDVISLFVVSFITFVDIRNGALILLLLFFFSLYNVTFFILFKLVLVINFKRKKINYLDYQDIVLVILYENYDDRVYGH